MKKKKEVIMAVENTSNVDKHLVWQTSLFGKIGLLNGIAFLRSKINVILAKGNIIMVLRKRSDQWHCYQV